MRYKAYLTGLFVIGVMDFNTNAQLAVSQVNNRKITESTDLHGSNISVGNSSCLGFPIDATVSLGESYIPAHLFCDGTTVPVSGIIVDSRQPDFELYTSKFVLVRIPTFNGREVDLNQTLNDIAATGAKGIILLPNNETREGPLESLKTFIIPVAVIASKDTSQVIQAAQTRLKISIQIK